MKNIIQYIKNWWNGVCPRHGEPYHLQGYEERQVCYKCWDEQHPSKEDLQKYNENL